MPVIEIIMDYFLQYMGTQFVKDVTYKMAQWFQNFFNTNIVKASNFLFHDNTNFVIYRDKNYLVVNKPPNILINSNDPEKKTVETSVQKYFPELCNSKLKHNFHFAHRLDYSTSGILCLPLNKRSCTKICKAFENRTVVKYYVAILNGHFDEGNKFVEINFEIGEDSRNIEGKRMCSTKNADYCLKPRSSKTLVYFCKNGYYKKNIPVSKVILMPVTGRRHQLRVHCCDINMPIFGDFTYGNDFDKSIDRMYLHAVRMFVPEELDLRTPDPFIDKKFEGLTIHLENIYERIKQIRK